jgi:5-carboxymethyl-2-hydroxymuconate isomerase
MPQISLKVSNNIDISRINFKDTFAAIHHVLGTMPNLDITTCHSGVIQEAYSYIGLGDDSATKVYLEILWLESSERLELKRELAERLMGILENTLSSQIEKQNLRCIPRVRIANLGTLGQDYHTKGRTT